MKRAVILLSALSLLLGNVTTTSENATIEPISDNMGIVVSLRNHENDVFKQRINLEPFSRLTVTVTDVPSDISFIVLQIHTFQYNATLAYDKALLDKVSSRSLFGSNIGLYLKTYNVKSPIQAFLKHDNIHKLDALLVIIAYGRNAPIPGGCNMEFDIEVAPYQKLHAGNGVIMVDAQPASVLARNGLPFTCEKNPVQHKMYRLYLPRQDFTSGTYFEAIASMLTVQDIVRNGDEIPPSLTSSMRRIYSAYTGTGSVYAVIASYGNYSSAYVPTFTYACSPLLYPESCQVLNDKFAEVICALVLIIGCLSIIKGYRFVSIDRLLSTGMMGGIVGYTLAVGVADTGTAINILIGLAFAILAISVSAFLHYHDLCILSCNLSLGFLCACIAYLYAPEKLFYILENDWLFWPTFVSLMLTVTLLLMMISYAADVITRAIFGSYFIIVAIDYYIGSNLKYIIITLIRRITIPGFHLAFVYPPYQGADITLIIIWFLLIITRFIIQRCSHLCERIKTYENREHVLESATNNTETASLLPNYHYSRYSGGVAHKTYRTKRKFYSWRRYRRV